MDLARVAAVTARLGNDRIHVWRLRYDRALKREPLRAVLGAYLGRPAASVNLIEAAHGRPQLAEPQCELQFNWSHTANMALIVVARGVVPGIDIERLRSRARAIELAKRFFHPDEAAALMALDEKERERAFLQLWTGKEAVLKATGRGIAFGLHRLCLTVAATVPRIVWLDGDDPAEWQLHSVQVDAYHVASVAWRGPPRKIETLTLADGA